MKSMVSFCLTIKNEPLLPLIRQIAEQSQLPDETIIVDSGRACWQHPKKNEIFKKLNIKYLFLKCSRSKGRNKAASSASHENLVFADAGSVFDKNLIKALSFSLNLKNAEVIAGRYKSVPTNFKEYLFAKFLNKDLSRSDTFYPSARIFGIKKKVFLDLKGFNENLVHAEDTEFFKRAVDHGYTITKNVKAVVFWQLPNLKEYFKKLFSYARGDFENSIWWDPRKKLETHNIKHLLTIFRWVLLFALFVFGFGWISTIFLGVYLLSSAVKNKINFKEFAGNNPLKIIINVVTFIFLKILTDFSVMTGFLTGIFL